MNWILGSKAESLQTQSRNREKGSCDKHIGIQLPKIRGQQRFKRFMEFMRQQDMKRINCDEANWNPEGWEENTGFEFWLDRVTKACKGQWYRINQWKINEEALEGREEWLQSMLNEPWRRERGWWERMKSGILMRRTKGFHVLKGN